MEKKLIYSPAIRAALLLGLMLPVSAFSASIAALQSLLTSTSIAQKNIHSVLVMGQGELIAEHYYRGVDHPIGDWRSQEKQFTATDLHDMRSISKTLIGLAVGIAID
jgi:CubicO group peptidase (beta-lactamase class C family)